MIRKAIPSDLPRLVEMGERFVTESSYRDVLGNVSPEALSNTIQNVVTADDGVIFVSGSDATPTGMIAMMVYSHPYTDERTAFELVWWVDPEARGDGLRLLRAAEGWAKEQGAIKIQMVAPNDRVGRLYSRLGYSPFETSYQRSL